MVPHSMALVLSSRPACPQVGGILLARGLNVTADRAVGEAVVASGASTVAQQMLSQPTGLAWE